MRTIQLIVLSCLIVLAGFSVVSSQDQDQTCPALAKTALENARQVCSGTGRNQACYGNVMLEAEPQPGVGNFNFDSVGDIVNVAAIGNMRLSAMNTALSQWGVALIEIQANIPASEPENVTLLLFGDVQIRPDAPPPSTELTALRPANIRRGPANDRSIIGWLDARTSLVANGRTSDNAWVRVEALDDPIGYGWVFAELVDGDFSTLPEVTDPDEVVFRPMQAFTFMTGANDTPCSSAPTNGLMIQTPEGVGEVRLLMNQVAVQLGSTAYFTAEPGRDMTVQMLEGRARVEAENVERIVPAGAQVRIPLDDDLHPVGAPAEPEPRAWNPAAAEDDETFEAVFHALPDERDYVDSLTDDEVEEYFSNGYDRFDAHVYFDDDGEAFVLNQNGDAVYIVDIRAGNVSNRSFIGEDNEAYIINEDGDVIFSDLPRPQVNAAEAESAEDLSADSDNDVSIDDDEDEDEDVDLESSRPDDLENVRPGGNSALSGDVDNGDDSAADGSDD